MFRDALHMLSELLKWQAFKDREMLLESPTRVQQMESWERAGKPSKYSQKIYHDELGRLIGVSTFTPAEIKEFGTFRPSEAQKIWMFRESRKMSPKAQLRIWVKEYEAGLRSKLELRKELRAELAGLQRIRKGEDVPAFLRVGGIGKQLDRRRELEDELSMGVDR